MPRGPAANGSAKQRDAKPADTINRIAPSIKHLAVPIDSLTPDPINAREHDEENMDTIRKSLARYGQRKTISVLIRDGKRIIMAGNGTWQAAKDLGWTEIAAAVDDDLSEIDAIGYGLTDNRASDLSSWNDRVVQALAQLMDDSGEKPIGWGMEELTALRRMNFDPPKVHEDEIPSEKADPVVSLGDRWSLGDHRLLCGDSTDVASYERLMAGVAADMVWTDPPYGVDVAGGSHDPRSHRYRSGDTLENDNLDKGQLGAFLTSALTPTLAATRPGAVWFVASPSGGLLGVYGNVLTELGVWRHTIIWVKDTFVFSRCDYHYRHESLFFGWTPGAGHNPVPDRKQDSVWEIARPTKSPEHPTMKPVELVERAVANHTKVGDLVLDPFGGTGTTLIASQKINRTCYTIELNPTYCDVILQRWARYTGLDPVREDGAKFSELVAGRDAACRGE